MHESSRQLAAIMYTDIVGYTALMQKSESYAFDLQQRHLKIIETEIARFNGRIINYYGDGTLSIFKSAVSAVKCGCGLQKHFRYNPIIPVRIGIHQGDIMVTDVDIVGDSVNIASRIESLGVEGCVLISGTVFEEIKNHEDLPVKSVGFYSFKNDSREREIFAIDLPVLVVPIKDSLDGKTIDKDKSKITTVGSSYRRRVKNILIVLVSLIALTLISWPVFTNWRNKNWARNEAPIKIQEMMDQNRNWEAFRIWEKAARFIPDAPDLKTFESAFVTQISLNSEHDGVSVFRKPHNSEVSSYELVGTTPFENRNVFNGTSSWMFAKIGYDTLYKLSWPYNFDDGMIEMPKTGVYPIGMVKIDGSNFPIMIPGISHIKREKLNAFLADKYEVTNEDFKKFVEIGGYTNLDYWKYKFEKDGKKLNFNDAMALLTDATDHRGPAGWELGDFPDDTENYPVTGISWYEAAAYAQFAGKALPTMYHWNLMASTWYSEFFVPLSNFEAKGLSQVGQFQGMSSNGVFDIAGNAREWCYNVSNRNDERFIMGGAWVDSDYASTDAGTADPWDRKMINGFRCIKYLDENENQDNLEKIIEFYYRDFMNELIVTDAEFEIIRRQYNYDKGPLNAESKDVTTSSQDWTIEEITFDAAYGDEIMMAYLFLPIDAVLPLQTVIYFPGSSARFSGEFDPAENGHYEDFDFIAKSGRAVLFPIYQSTYNRADKITSDYPNESNYYKERFIMWGKDLRRSIDYLETREDIDSDKLAFYGNSWGGPMGGLMGAIEPRLKCLIIKSGGLYHQPAQKEVDLINYLPHVTQPVLMINGKHDILYPLKSSQIPMFALFGTDPENKQHKLYDVNHSIPRPFLITDVLGWLDTYLGENVK